MIDYSVTQLIADIERHGAVPPNQELYDDDDFCSTMDDCQKMRIVPAMLNVREEFFVKTRDYDLSELTELPGNRLQLTLPPRVIAGRLRGVELIDANTNLRVAILPRLAPEVAAAIDWQNMLISYGDSYAGYIFQGNSIIIPQSLTSENLKIRLKYFRRPNRIVDMSQAGKITAINTMTGTLTLNSKPTDMVTGTKVDIISGSEPFDATVESYELLAASGLTVNVSVATAALLAIGDYVCFEFETVIPQLPVECFPILVQFTTAAVLKSLGDAQGALAVMTDLPKLEDNIYAMMSGRDEGSAQKIIAPGGIWTSRRRW